ncbi:MAG: von Willebrand factor type A domain-containing protein [Verrucomicrobiota bacterium JB023]|nr:von Willebrand factor type A domain-containing protein [Verrucomicrobiota bacterium JB023]
MKRLRPDDPRVTSYALGELQPREARIVEENLQNDPSLADEMTKTQALGRILCAAYEKQGLSLHPVQREVIRRVGRDRKVVALRSARRRNEWVRGGAITSAAVATVAFGLFLLHRMPVDQERMQSAEVEELQMDVVLSPAAVTEWGNETIKPSDTATPQLAQLDQGNGQTDDDSLREAARQEATDRILRDPQHFFASAELTARRHNLPSAESFVPLQENEYLSSSDAPSTVVPVMAGRTSFAWVERFLREQGQLPPRDAVRLEELVNYPDYKEEAGRRIGGVALTTELVPCPWNPDSLLLGILLQREPGSEKEEKVSVRLEVKENRVASYRLLGFARPDNEVIASADASHPLAAGNSTYVFYEVKPTETPFNEAPLGRVAMKVTSGGTSVYEHLAMPSIPGRWLESSNSFRTAATVAAYALVLRDSPFKGSLDFARVESLARQTLHELPHADPDTRDVLELIIETRSLAGLAPRA